MAAGCVAMMIGAVLLFSRSGTDGWVPYLLLVACPLMHVVMHKSMHGGHRDQRRPPPLPAHPDTETPKLPE